MQLGGQWADKLLTKQFWTGLLGETKGEGARKYSLEELKARYDILQSNPVILEANKGLVVETIRSIAEFMIWGDQHEPRIFEFLKENNIMVYLQQVLQQVQNRTGDVAKQVLQTLSIVVQNVRSDVGFSFLFSNNHVNNIIETRFDFTDEEVLGYFITFLKAVSVRLTAQTAQYFLIPRTGAPAGVPRLPLYEQALPFAHHKEGMVRAGVRTLTLSVYSVHDRVIRSVVTSTPAVNYFNEVAAYIGQQTQALAQELPEAYERYSPQTLASLDSRLAELEDILTYCGDALNTAQSSVADQFSRSLWQGLAVKTLLQPFMPGAPNSPSSHAISCAYVLERAFRLLNYAPLLNNLALALVGHPSHSAGGVCRQRLIDLLQSPKPLCSTAAVRLLVAIQSCEAVSGELRSLGLCTPVCRQAPQQPQCWCFLDSPAGEGGGMRYWDTWNDHVSHTDVSDSVVLSGPMCFGSINEAVEEVLQDLVEEALQHAHTTHTQHTHTSDRPTQQQQEAPPCAACVARRPLDHSRQVLAALLLVLGEAHTPIHTLILAAYLLCYDSLSHTAKSPCPHPLTLEQSERQALIAALTKTAEAVGERLSDCWPDAFFPVFQHERSVSAAGIRTPRLLSSADQLVTPQLVRSANASVLQLLGLGPTAVQALQLVNAVQHFTAVLHVCQSLSLLSAELPAQLSWMLTELERTWGEVLEGQQVTLSKANSVSCQVCFVPPDPIRVSLAVAGQASEAIFRYAGGQHASRTAQGVLAHSSPTVVLAQCQNNIVDAGVVVSTAPLLGSRFYQDPKVAVWLHVMVRPSVHSLLKQVKKAVQRRGGLLSCLRNLSDGHWILQFKDGSRVLEALRLMDSAASTATEVYKDVVARGFISAWLSAVVW